jgi:rhodanese-related sulfurtransferase
LPLPDFAAIHQQRQGHKHATLQLLWEEYRQGNPDGYHYSRFCELYQRWRRKQDVVLRQEHKAGEKLFVDWAGDTTVVISRLPQCARLGVTPNKQVVTYCNSGMQATQSYFTLKYLGYDVRLYDGSMSEWTSKGAPVEK